MKYALIAWAIILVGLILNARMFLTAEAEASRDSCECRELRAIRRLLEHQFNVVCDERRCLPVPTPTVPDGGNLP